MIWLIYAQWLAILALTLSIVVLRKGIHDLEDVVAGMEERFNRRLTYLEQNQKHK
jgi:hypothetical protein